MVDLDDRSNCPVDDHCITCGDSDDLAVATAGSPLGVFCLTVCGDCEEDGALPELGHLEAFELIGSHCEHLGITLDDMAEAIELASQEADNGPYADLDPDELADTSNDFDGDVEAEADHLRRLREWYTVPQS